MDGLMDGLVDWLVGSLVGWLVAGLGVDCSPRSHSGGQVWRPSHVLQCFVPSAFPRGKCSTKNRVRGMLRLQSASVSPRMALLASVLPPIGTLGGSLIGQILMGERRLDQLLVSSGQHALCEVSTTSVWQKRGTVAQDDWSPSIFGTQKSWQIIGSGAHRGSRMRA